MHLANDVLRVSGTGDLICPPCLRDEELYRVVNPPGFMATTCARCGNTRPHRGAWHNNLDRLAAAVEEGA